MVFPSVVLEIFFIGKGKEVKPHPTLDLAISGGSSEILFHHNPFLVPLNSPKLCRFEFPI
jgi:hypothetical protein